MSKRKRVEAERRRRGWSIRRAAIEAGISNETWRLFESGERTSDATEAAITQVFEWPENWAELDEVIPGDVVAELRQRLDAVEARLDALERPAAGDVIPFRPRQPEQPPPAAPAQPAPERRKAAKKSPGTRGDGRRVNRPEPPVDEG